jgi:hypothetical protein
MSMQVNMLALYNSILSGQKHQSRYSLMKLCLKNLKVRPLIHTGLQPGVCRPNKSGNRFNGFSVRQLT